MGRTRTNEVAAKPEAEVLTAEEKAAMKALVKERRRSATREEGEKALLEAVAAMAPPSRKMAEALHRTITANAPGLAPKTWYGMPAYADAEGKTVLFFRAAEKFKERYMTLGFNQEAKLDEGRMWPVVYALTAFGAEEEERVAALVRQATGT